jgi:hypothetical protein
MLAHMMTMMKENQIPEHIKMGYISLALTCASFNLISYFDKAQYIWTKRKFVTI